MSIRASRNRHTLSALAVLTVVAVVVIGGLELLARRGESSGEVYPYKWEDWLRYLVPTLWTAHEQPALMLTGPSTARENFLLEDFASAFPRFRVAPCAISLATFRDITAGLEYVEREYGRKALPAVVVLGISPRFLAEIPADRPFANALERYSRHFGPPADPNAAFGLTRKPALEGTVDFLRFRLTKQGGRYRSAMAWAITRVLSPRASESIRNSPIVRFAVGTRLGHFMGVDWSLQAGPREFGLQYIAPYRYQPALIGMPGRELAAALDDTGSWWHQVFQWDPDSVAPAIRARAAALISWASQRGIDVYVVRLPEHSGVRQRLDPLLAARFDTLIQAAFAPAPVLDLSCLLPDEQFLDAEHALWPGAKRISAHVIGYLKAVRQSGTSHDSVRALTHQWSRGGCAFD